MRGRSDDLDDKLLRLAVLGVACPQCLAAPQARCTGVKGQRRSSSHQGRWDAYRAGEGGSPREVGPSPREAALQIMCPSCHAQPGQACMGITGKPRSSVHQVRLDAVRFPKGSA